jgi:hypothetical protein
MALNDEFNNRELNNASSSPYRIGAVLVIVAMVIAYTVAVVVGLITPEHRIDAVTLAVIALAVICIFLLMNPGIFERLKVFEMSGFKLEMLERVKEKQAEQENKLEDISLILPLLLPKVERKHLLNLANGKTKEYKGSAPLRAELRRLRTATLIKSHPASHIGQIEDGSKVDLTKHVGLTPLGERWVRRIRQIEQAEMQEDE